MFVKKSHKKQRISFVGTTLIGLILLGNVAPIQASSSNSSSGIEGLALVKHSSDLNISHEGRFLFDSWTFPSLNRLDLSLNALGGRAYSPLDRDRFFNDFVTKTERTRKTEEKFLTQQVEGQFHLPSAFDVKQQYPFLIYLPGSGGLCTSEEALVTRITQTGAVVVVVKSNLSRAGGDKRKASSSESQLDKNHINLAMDAVRVAELLEGHPNVRGLGAVGSSLGAVALTALADRAISGPLYKYSHFVRPEDMLTGGSHWINASPFRALFLLTPTFPLHLPNATTPAQTRVTVFSGAHDLWCEVGPTLDALSTFGGFTNLHLLDMGHGPEALWDQEWKTRVSKYPDAYEEVDCNGTRIIVASKGQNISDCASLMPPLSLFGAPIQTKEEETRLLEVLTVHIRGAYPGIALEKQPDNIMSALIGLLARTRKGTALEPDSKAVEYIVTHIQEGLKFVKDTWTPDLWLEAVSDTFASQSLARRARDALVPYGDRLREADDLLKKRAHYQDALQDVVTRIPRSQASSSLDDLIS